MNSSLPQEIQKLKDNFFNAKFALQKRKTLITNRDELEEIIIKLKQELKYENQYLVDYTKTKTLSQLVQKMRDLDHLLDESEELTEESLKEMERTLIRTLLELYPNENSKFENLSNRMEMTTNQVISLGSIKSQLVQIEEILKAVIQTREGIKGIGILKYVFGTSPNLIIARLLKEGGHIAQQSIKSLEDFVKNDNNNEIKFLFVEIIMFLKKLEPKLAGTWGFKTIDIDFRNSEKQIFQNILQLTSLERASEIEKQKAENELEQWIQQF
ncbi:MAG: hypothetical protein H0W88_10860 [Parachlamydiaceae bacterium]|nr:hypothetical protein [Parachlamydiaceae bacterium]